MSMEIIDINKGNLANNPGIVCFINPKNPSFAIKPGWLDSRFGEGLKIKAAINGKGKVAGFIEYVPAKLAWRAVSCPNHMFIHCLWVSSKDDRNKGLGSSLVRHAVDDARTACMDGVAVLTSTDAFMANDEVFLKLGFSRVDESGDYRLLSLDFGNPANKPHILDNSAVLESMKGWHILYSRQYPWVARMVSEIQPLLDKNGITAQIREITTPEEVRSCPSVYGAFCLVKDGRLLAQRYVSLTRLQNIIDKE